MYNTLLPSSAQFQSLYLAVGQLCKLCYYLRSVNYIWPELELELELILTKILELELELNAKTVAGIGIWINSNFSECLKVWSLESTHL